MNMKLEELKEILREEHYRDMIIFDSLQPHSEQKFPFGLHQLVMKYEVLLSE